MSKLSVLIPAYNERQTILTLIDQVRAVELPIEKEILVGDDGSTDGTREMLRDLEGEDGLHIHFMEKNVGRGGVIKSLWKHVTGDIVVHQDADLEYVPDEYNLLLPAILEDRADVVFGSRFKGSIENMRALNNLGNRCMSLAARVLYGLDVSDLMTCYKMYRASYTREIDVVANGFDFEAEFTARLVQRGARFHEVPISFEGRSFEEGKKIRAMDAVYVTQKLISCKFSKGGRDG